MWYIFLITKPSKELDDTAQRTECPAVVRVVGGRIDAVGHW